MSFSCSTTGFPRVTCFADAKRHYDQIKHWRGGDLLRKPIGARYSKHKEMRRLDDGSIAFKLHRTDCAVWHPDNTVTVTGHPSVSTTVFLSMLLPSDVQHGQGAWRGSEPILVLRSNRETRAPEYPTYGEPGYDEARKAYYDYWRGFYRSGQIIRCSKPVTLHYSADDQRWMPADVRDLEPFETSSIDRKASKVAAAKYHLDDFEAVVDAVIALSGVPDKVSTYYYIAPYGQVMDLLAERRLMDAIALLPRGQSYAFGKDYGTPDGIKPGVLKRLRDHVYAHEGALKVLKRPILTVSQYEAHKRASKRFG